MVYLISMNILTFLRFFVLFLSQNIRAISCSIGPYAIFGVIQRSMAFIHGFEWSINKKFKRNGQFRVEMINKGWLNR